MNRKNKSFALKRLLLYHQKPCFNTVLKQSFDRQATKHSNHLICRYINKILNLYPLNSVHTF
ncbi:hypothetical protein DW228_20270 [Bacteroides fragilis]|uniref:Uncharacterized protein n=1 Tax=Bacteroides fragilis TaxID=817 RepID=A0A396BN23_BACFG|nr:hypothetical protein DXB60_15270 [Bacteroides fragilis]RHH06987.1 hypothetical protein DW228_20270 [Bacteroides fragilis]